MLGGTVQRPNDDPSGWPELPFGGTGRLGRGRVRCRCSARPHAWIARVAVHPLRAVLGGRELLRHRRLLSASVCRSDILGALSRAEVDSEHRLRGLALEGVRGLGESRAHSHLNARHGSQEPNNRARGAQNDGRLLKTPPAARV